MIIMEDSLSILILALMGVVIYLLLTLRKNKEEPKIDIKTPKNKAKLGETYPLGIGLFFVLFIKISISESYHIFIALDPPAERVPPIIVINIVKKVASTLFY